MTFEELPPDWQSLPLSDDAPHVTGVLDLVVDLEARRRGSLVFLICDGQGRPVQPVVVDDAPPHPTGESPAMLVSLAEAIARLVPDPSVLCAVARTRPSRIRSGDRAWRAVIDKAFAGQVGVIGVHVVADGGTWSIAPAQQAA